jgi:DNA-binding NarL/FixJ family response regulator
MVGLEIIQIEPDPLWAKLIQGVLEDRCAVDRVVHFRGGVPLLGYSGTLRAGVIVLEFYLGDIDGFQLIDSVLSINPRVGFLFITHSVTPALLRLIERLPRSSVLWKGTDLETIGEQIKHAISSIMSGRTYFGAEIRGAFKQFRQGPHVFSKILSDSELSLIPSFCLGLSDAEIADKACVCAATIRSHRHSILKKLRLASTPKLMCWARAQGFDTRLFGHSEYMSFEPIAEKK